MQNNEQSAKLKIGAVARLTGVSVHTLRKWEDRYDAVEPKRTAGGERLYTRTDAERIGLIKRLADAGLSLREIASLSLVELGKAWEQLVETTGAAAGRSPARVRVAILGGSVAAMTARTVAAPGLLQVVTSAQSPTDLEEALSGESVDVLVYECPALQPDMRRAVNDLMARFNARGAVVVYGFGARADVLALQSTDISTLRAPADLAALEQAALGLVSPGAAVRVATGPDAFQYGNDVPAPRLSREVIAHVAQRSPRMRCECPHHLADIVTSLRAFEEYSADCESRHAEDASLHHYLWRSAAHARALFEDAIERVAEVEGINLKP